MSGCVIGANAFRNVAALLRGSDAPMKEALYLSKLARDGFLQTVRMLVFFQHGVDQHAASLADIRSAALNDLGKIGGDSESGREFMFQPCKPASQCVIEVMFERAAKQRA